MMTRLAYVGICVLLVIGVIGCAPDSSNSDTNSASLRNNEVSGNSASQLISSTESPGTSASGAVQQSSLTYQDIVATMKQILENEALPYEERVSAVKEYQRSLQGSRVQGWTGWVVAVTPTKETVERYEQVHGTPEVETKYSVSITFDTADVARLCNPNSVKWSGQSKGSLSRM